MKRRVEILPATAEHAESIALRARPADVAELQASSRSTPLEAMLRGIASSTMSYTGFVDGVPVCLFGVAPFSIMTGKGIVWMIGSTELDRPRVQRELLRFSHIAVGYMREHYPTMLFNFVDQRNESALRWLRWLGFSFDEPIAYGDDGLPFVPVYITGTA